MWYTRRGDRDRWCDHGDWVTALLVDADGVSVTKRAFTFLLPVVSWSVEAGSFHSPRPLPSSTASDLVYVVKFVTSQAWVTDHNRSEYQPVPASSPVTSHSTTPFGHVRGLSALLRARELIGSDTTASNAAGGGPVVTSGFKPVNAKRAATNTERAACMRSADAFRG